MDPPSVALQLPKISSFMNNAFVVHKAGFARQLQGGWRRRLAEEEASQRREGSCHDAVHF
jgi:hypothetical protein